MSDKLKTIYKHIHYIEKTQGKKSKTQTVLTVSSNSIED